MTKNILLAAASVVALGFAGAASAADLSVALPGGVTVSSTTPAASRDAYTIASEVEGTQTGEIAITTTYVDPLPDANNLLITYTLGGGATFATAVASTDLAGFANRTISAGGEAGSSSVTILVSTPTAATGTRDAAVLTADITFDAGDQPSVQVNTRTEIGTPIEGGNAIPQPLVIVDYDSFISVDTTPASTQTLDSDTNFSTFGNGTDTASLGTFTIDVDDSVFVDFDGTQAADANLEGAELTLTGSLADLDITVNNGADVDGNVITVDAPGTYTVTATIEDGGAPTGSSYSLTADLDLAAGFDDQDNVVVGPLASIRREGTSVVVPWVASGSLSAANNTRNVLRISNSGETTGQVYMEVISSAAAQGVAPTSTGAVVATGLTVPANSDLQITSQQMQNILGDFRRADIRVTVEANDEDLIFRSRVVQMDGTFEEITLEEEGAGIN